VRILKAYECLRASERQRASGYELRRQYAAWPGNAIKARIG